MSKKQKKLRSMNEPATIGDLIKLRSELLDGNFAITKNLEMLGRLSVDQRNMLISRLGNGKCTDPESLTSESCTCDLKFKLSKKDKKKLKKYINKRVDEECTEMCYAILGKVYGDLNSFIDTLPCNKEKGCSSSPFKVEMHDLGTKDGQEAFQKLFRDIFGDPSEVFGNSSDDKSDSSKDEKKDKNIKCDSDEMKDDSKEECIYGDAEEDDESEEPKNSDHANNEKSSDDIMNQKIESNMDEDDSDKDD